MICAWKELLRVIPPGFRNEVDKYGREEAQEIRLRLGSPPEIRLGSRCVCVGDAVDKEDIYYCINTASRYSPWASETMQRGYLTAPGGHRIGICGQAVIRQGRIEGVREISALCIRVAREFPGIAGELAEIPGSLLILGAPGWGKTTLLRDLIRQRTHRGASVAVVDERGELFPAGLCEAKGIDVMYGCSKARGVEMLLRTMGPTVIAMDEITAKEDCEALQSAACCGVELIATAHAASSRDFHHRPVYEPLVRQGLFDTLVVLHPDKTWTVERSGAWAANGSVRY